MNLSKLSDIKLKLLEHCYYGILQANEEKIQQALNKYYSTDDFMEEECTIQAPDILIKRTGISHDLYLGGNECVDDNLEP